MDNLIFESKIFSYYEYSLEDEFEKHIIEHSNDIFGPKSVYLDIKKKIGQDNIVTIPDGYLIDFSFENDPRLYIVENELVTHDPYKHIGQQLLKFAISYKLSGRKIKKFLLENLLKDAFWPMVENGFRKAGYRNIDNFLEDIIFDKPVAAIVLIDESTPDLENVLRQLTMQTDIIEFQTFVCGEEHIHKFTPFQQEIREYGQLRNIELDVETFDTIVVPAHEEGFNEVFIGEDCWYSIRISSSMLNKIKYIAAYQTNPISAITYFAEVSKIEKYNDTNKYILYFKDKAQKIGPLKIEGKKAGLALRSPRYTSSNKLFDAKTLNDVFS